MIKQLIAIVSVLSSMQLTDGARAAVPAVTYPAGVSIRASKLGNIHVDKRGMTLYALNVRQAAFRSGVGRKFCVGPCAQIWKVFAAPAAAKSVGDWQVLEGAQGPQWAYKGNLVFTHAADHSPAATDAVGYDDLWNAIAYVPPAPNLVAPATVAPLLVGGVYILGDTLGHALYSADCAASRAINCAGLTPFLAGLASQGVGDWTVLRGGDRPQWAYRGRGVYVGENPTSLQAAAHAKALRP